MTGLCILISRFMGLFRKAQHERELDEELRSHLEMLTEENVRRGMSPEEARYAALRAFGGVEQTKERYREQRGLPSIESFLQDLRYALRQLRRNPGFTTVAVITLALGIGANTAIFSLINAALLRPLPGIEDPERLVSLYRMQKNDAFDVKGYPDYLDYRNRGVSFSGLAAEISVPISFGGSAPERLVGGVVSGNYFSVLGVTAEQGRLITPSDDAPRGGHPAVVLSYGLWQRRFGADPAAVGRQVQVNGYPFTIIGVAGQPFRGAPATARNDLWVPLRMLDEALPWSVGQRFFEERAWGWLRVIGRLKPGVTMEQAQAETSAIARQLAAAYPNTNAGRAVALVSGIGLDPEDRANLGGFLGILLGSVALLLLIACANVAGLLLVRATGREREMALRLILGATRVRLIRQLLTEGWLLASAGGAVGVLLAPWALRLAVVLTAPGSMLRHADSSLDARVLAFALALSVVTAVGFALLPAWHASRSELVPSLSQGTAGSGRRRSPLQRLLAAAQIAVSMMLLVAAALLVRSMQKVLNTDPGFETRNILLGSVDVSLQRYSAAQGEAFYENVLARLARIPGVLSASIATTVPPEDFSSGVSVFRPGEEPPQEVLRGRQFELGIRVNLDVVGPAYFRTLRITLLQGRDFTERDGEGTLLRDGDGNLLGRANSQNGPGVAIINQKLAERLWPRENAVGKHIAWPTVVGPPRPPLEVIGVAADSKYRSLVDDSPLLMYVPVRQNFASRAAIVLRTASNPAGMMGPLRREIAALDKSLPLFNVETMAQHLSPALWKQRMAASLIGCFGALALLLATLGLYGVVANSVVQRTHEIGIRMALGAGHGDVLRQVIAEGVGLMVVGVAVGTLGALVLTRFLASLLYGVQPSDPATFALVVLLLAVVGVVASYVPARRATKVDPMVALRYE